MEWRISYRTNKSNESYSMTWMCPASSRESRSGSCLVSDHYVFAFWVVAYYPWKPRGGQSGREKRRRQFSRTGERGPGMLLLSNQYHDSFELLSLIGQKNNMRPAILPIALLSWPSYSKELNYKLDFSPSYLSGSCKRAFETGQRQLFSLI